MRRQTLIGLALVVSLLAACGPAATSTPEASTPPALTPAATTPPTPAGPTYDNPVFAGDFPDPHILRVGAEYYAYSTTSGSTNIPVLRSADLTHWERLGDALPALPAWASVNRGYTWAPGVIQVGETFVMYFTARDTASDRQCISRGASAAPDGPFSDERSEAWICQVDLGGSIDPYPFRDEDGQLYLLWKNDGNCCGKSVGLWVQALSPDGLELAGQPTELVQRDQAWERPLIENPALVKHAGKYYLFYSGNRWESHEYAVGYAVCDSLTGPCQKPLTEPLFSFTPQAMGPGGQAFFEDAAGQLWMAYHAWIGPTVGYPAGQRALHIDPVQFEGDQPVIDGPTTDPQPMP